MFRDTLIVSRFEWKPTIFHIHTHTSTTQATIGDRARKIPSQLSDVFALCTETFLELAFSLKRKFFKSKINSQENENF